MALGSHEIAAFLTIYQHRSIGRAAAALGVTQPGLSRILRKLEDQLGAPLFERHPFGVLATPAAEVLLPYAEEIASNTRTAIEEVASLKGAAVSTVRVGTIASVGSALLSHAIERLLKRWPSLRVQLIEGIEDHLSEALARGEIDIAIAGRMEHSEVPFSRPDLLGTTLVVIANRNHQLAKMPVVGLPDLLRHRWVLPPLSTPSMQYFHQLFRQAGLDAPVATVETRSNNAIKSLVAITDLLAWQPRTLLPSVHDSGEVVEINAPDLMWRRQFFIFKRRRGILAPAAMKLVDEIRGLCREEASRISLRDSFSSSIEQKPSVKKPKSTEKARSKTPMKSAARPR